MYKNGFGIYDLQWLMCHKTKPNQTSYFNLQSLLNISIAAYIFQLVTLLHFSLL